MQRHSSPSWLRFYTIAVALCSAAWVVAFVYLPQTGMAPLSMGIVGLWAFTGAAWGYFAFRQWQNTERPEPDLTLPGVLDRFETSQNETLRALSERQPVLLVFLRHFGCTFCREALHDLAQEREALEAEGTRLAFVHMADGEYATQYLSKYGLADAPHVSDPACTLYRAFNLERATFGQVFGWKSWARGVYAGIGKGQGVGKLVGDGFRMPGVFLLHKGRVVKAFRHRTASDVPDYAELSACPLPVQPS